VKMTTVYMRNPHLTPKARGPNSNRLKRLKQGDRKWLGVLKKLEGSSTSGY
jgi:hypothetical protein